MSLQQQNGTVMNANEPDPDWLARLEALDLQTGHVIREPPGRGPGYWAGAPGAYFDEVTGSFWLVYRLRRPRGVHPDRGAVFKIAQSDDGTSFRDIWTGHKEQLQSTSIERCALSRLPSGNWALYVSYVDPTDGRWRIDVAEADDPSAFDLVRCRPALGAADISAEGVKDPHVFRHGRRYCMLASYAVSDKTATARELHGSHDAYNTGLIKSCTGLAVSDDGRAWDWQGGVLFPSDEGWDCYCARIGTVWREDDMWLALYDGSATVGENYEERCGLAVSTDLRSFECLTRKAPLWGRRGALRYFDVVRRPGAKFLYYEISRLDGSHELRVLKYVRR